MRNTICLLLLVIMASHASGQGGLDGMGCFCTNGALPCKGGTKKDPSGGKIILDSPSVTMKCSKKQNVGACSTCCVQDYGCEGSYFIPSFPGDDKCNPLKYVTKDSISKPAKDGKGQIRDFGFFANCARAIMVDAVLARQHLKALAEYYDEYYVFNDLAKNPLASPSNTGNWTHQPVISIYSEKVDLQAELKALSDSLVIENGQTPLAPVFFGIFGIFIKLRDNHVNPIGASGSFGQIFITNEVKLIPVYQDGSFNNRWTDSPFLTKTVNNRPVLFDVTLNKTIASIGGKDIISWALSIVKGDVLGVPYKDVNVRVNKILGSDLIFKFAEGTNINILPWEKKTWSILYTDGTKATLTPVALFSDFYVSSSVRKLTLSVSKPGTPFSVFRSAASQFLAPITQESNPSTSPTLDPPLERHRKLQATPIGQLKPIYECRDFTDPNRVKPNPDCVEPIIGYYGIINDTTTGKPAALWKLQNFEIDSNSYLIYWSELVTLAEAAGVTNLIYDLTGNTGGYVPTAYTAIAAIYPELIYDPSNTYPFFNLYDRRIGRSAQYLLQEALTYTGLQQILNVVLPDLAFFEARAAYLNSNATAVAQLVALTEAAFSSTTSLFTDTYDVYRGCSQGTAYCKPVNKKYIENIGAIVKDIYTPGTPITGQGLQAAFSAMANWTLALAPFSELRSADSYDINSGKVPIYQTSTERLISRGGARSYYTGLYTLVSKSGFPTTFPKTNPFKQILALGNGLCGSSCDTFSRSTWFYSKNNPQAPSFRYVTTGGTGSPSMAPTSFQGGNVAGDQTLTQAIGYYASATTTAAWSGNAFIQETVKRIFPSLPQIPAYMVSALPRFSQSELYQPSLGPNSLPLEFYLIPTDYYLPYWHNSVKGPEIPPEYFADVYPAVINLFKPSN